LQPYILITALGAATYILTYNWLAIQSFLQLLCTTSNCITVYHRPSTHPPLIYI
jgi:hypothetical protein